MNGVSPGRWVERAWDRLSVYLPVMLMGLLALGTYWLARNTPTFAPAAAARAPTHQPDYFMRNFSVKSFDASGRLKSEVFGAEARHYPDTDTLEIDKPRIRTFSEKGALTVATATRAITNADASHLQLMGNAVVIRESGDAPRLEIRSEFLQAFVPQERIESNRPVVLRRGNDQFSADGLTYDNLERVLEMRGRVRGVLTPAPAP